MPEGEPESLITDRAGDRKNNRHPMSKNLSIKRKSRHVIGNKHSNWRLFSPGCILGERDFCLASEVRETLN